VTEVSIEKYSQCSTGLSGLDALKTNAQSSSPPAFTPKFKRHIPIVPYFNDVTRNE